MLGYSAGDVIGRSIWEVHGSDIHRQELRTKDHLTSSRVVGSGSQQGPPTAPLPASAAGVADYADGGGSKQHRGLERQESRVR